jgi:type I restriction enzyme S subunit
MSKNLPSNWQQKKLEDCMEAIIDYRGKTPEKTSFGLPLITAKIVKDGRINNIQEYIAIKDYDSWMCRGLPQPGDIVMTTEAPLGEIAQLDNRKVALAQRLITLRGNPKILNNNYLKFLMQSSIVQNQLQERATGTTVLGIKQSELRKINLVLPPLSEQKAIAHILGTLDDKIELNKQMNETLEAIARAIFKSWFVNFDPVRAKMEGKKPPGMDAATADLFPDEFEESSLGLIPKGWRVGTLGDITENPRRGVKPENITPNTPYIGLEHMPKRSISLSDWGSVEDINSNKYQFLQGEILFGKLRPYFHKVGVAVLDGICSTDILVITPKSQEWFSFVLSIVSSDNFISYTNLISTGTRMPRTNWNDMSKYQIITPSIDIIKTFNHQLIPFINQIKLHIFESHTLATIRDTLLPKLISGKIRVKEAEKILEGVS